MLALPFIFLSYPFNLPSRKVVHPPIKDSVQIADL